MRSYGRMPLIGIVVGVLAFASCRGEKMQPAADVPAAPDYESLMTRATALVSNSRPERAIAPYNAALVLRPRDAEALYGRGLARLMLKDPEGALGDLNGAIETEPTYADAYFVRGEAKRALEDMDEAKKDYARYLEIDPDGPYGEKARAWVANEQGISNEAAPAQD